MRHVCAKDSRQFEVIFGREAFAKTRASCLAAPCSTRVAEIPDASGAAHSRLQRAHFGARTTPGANYFGARLEIALYLAAVCVHV